MCGRRKSKMICRILPKFRPKKGGGSVITKADTFFPEQHNKGYPRINGITPDWKPLRGHYAGKGPTSKYHCRVLVAPSDKNRAQTEAFRIVISAIFRGELYSEKKIYSVYIISFLFFFFRQHDRISNPVRPVSGIIFSLNQSGLKFIYFASIFRSVCLRANISVIN